MNNETKELLEETTAEEETSLTGAAEELEDTGDTALAEAPEDEEEAEEDEADEEEDEEYEDEPLEEIVHATTEIDGPLLDVMARVTVNQTPKKTRTTYLAVGLVALLAAVVCVMLDYTMPGCLLLVVAFFLLQSWYACNVKVVRKRLQKSEGLHWDYTVDKQGVHVGKTVNDRCIGWNQIKRGWLENDFYLMEVQGSLVVIRRSTLNDSERNLLELLMLENLKKCTL